MARDHVAVLISSTYEPDELEQMVPTEVCREVYCRIYSVSQGEWFKAGNAGLQAKWKLTMFASDYHGEDAVEVDQVRYGVYRTYSAGDIIELYLEDKGGLHGGY